MSFVPAVVAHYKDGRVRKGYTRNFSFFRETFDLVEVDAETGEEIGSVEVPVEELKALFFVKDFRGDASFQPDPTAERYGFGDRVEVTFHDRETLVGYTPRYRDDTQGFLLYPADPRTNNQLVAVIRSSVTAVKTEKKHSYFRP